MKTKQEIIEYLGIEYENQELIENWLNGALEIEKKYAKELKDGKYGYGLSCDIEVSGRLEDECYELKPIENINDVVVYEKILQE